MNKSRLRRLPHLWLFIRRVPICILLAACLPVTPQEAGVTLVLPPTRTPPPVSPLPAAPPAASMIHPPPSDPQPVDAPPPNLRIDPDSLRLSPERLHGAAGPPRVGDALQVSFTVHNDGEAAVSGALVTAAMARAEIPRTTFVEHARVDLPAGGEVAVQLTLGRLSDSELASPFRPEFGDGRYVVAASVNRDLRDLVDGRFYWSSTPTREANEADNVVQAEITYLPFESYTSEACPAGANLAIDPTDVALQEMETAGAGGAAPFLALTVRNSGNAALYHIPIRVLGAGGLRFAYHTGILTPCGGAGRVFLPVNAGWGDTFTIAVNAPDDHGGVEEEDYSDNQIQVTLSALATPAP